MRRLVLIFLGAGLFCGCAARDPLAGTRDPLATGEEAITYLKANTYHPRAIDGKNIHVQTAQGEGLAGAGFLTVPSGVRVRVVDDPAAATRPRDEAREVRVNILEGRWTGSVGTISRDLLRRAGP